MNIIRNLFFTPIILIVLFFLVSSSASDSDIYKHIDFNKAGFYLQIPLEWKYSAPDQIYSTLFNIGIRSKSRDEYSNFEDEIDRREEFKTKLSKTVKENQFFCFLKSEPFETKSRLKGLKSVYGYSNETPSSISYFFKNEKEDFIEICLKFRIWETKEIWKNIDKIILNGLGLK